MKTIKLQKIKLTAFKGIKSLEIDFSDETQIFGANGTGKTTIFDAITWLLFGKDSSDRKDFEIKTLDNNGNAIPKIDHEVEATLDVDGDLIEIKRVYSEKWVKERGAETAAFTGHQTNFFWNGVPMKQIDFQREVNNICDEFVFKLITSPTAFNSLPWKERRNILIQIAGEISNEELTGTNQAYSDLIQKLAKYNSEDDYKKMLQASVKKAKEEISVIPSRIDEVEKSKPEPVNMAALNKELESHTNKLSEVESQIEDSTKAYQSELDKINLHNKEILRLKSILDEFRYEAQREANKSQQSKTSKLDEIKRIADSKEREINSLKSEIQGLENSIKTSTYKLENISSEMKSKREEWTNINAEECKDSTVCPSCNQGLPPEKVDEIISKFKANKDSKLSAINTYGASLKNELEQTTQLLEQNNSRLELVYKTLSEKESEHTAALESLQAEQKQIESSVSQSPESIAANILSENKDFQSKLKELQNLESNPPAQPEVNNDELKAQRDEIRDRIESLKSDLSKSEQIKSADLRITELSEREKELAQQIANVDKDIFTLEAFTKLKVDEIEKRVRGKFSAVSFRMFKEQINGGLEPTCETLIDGVPFSDANTASKINAGIDIINTLSEFYGITAPIFIDNRESVTDIIETKAQIINLIVSPADTKLRIQKLEK